MRSWLDSNPFGNQFGFLRALVCKTANHACFFRISTHVSSASARMSCKPRTFDHGLLNFPLITCAKGFPNSQTPIKLPQNPLEGGIHDAAFAPPDSAHAR